MTACCCSPRGVANECSGDTTRGRLCERRDTPPPLVRHHGPWLPLYDVVVAIVMMPMYVLYATDLYCVTWMLWCLLRRNRERELVDVIVIVACRIIVVVSGAAAHEGFELNCVSSKGSS